MWIQRGRLMVESKDGEITNYYYHPLSNTSSQGSVTWGVCYMLVAGDRARRSSHQVIRSIWLARRIYPTEGMRQPMGITRGKRGGRQGERWMMCLYIDRYIGTPNARQMEKKIDTPSLTYIAPFCSLPHLKIIGGAVALLLSCSSGGLLPTGLFIQVS